MRVLIAAGGTAGHINPALAIAGALKAADPTAEIHFAGRREGMEYGLVTKAGYPFHHIEINGFQRHLSLENIGRNIVAIWHLALSGPEGARDWAQAGHRLALATVVKTWGSAPRRVGSLLLVRVGTPVSTGPSGTVVVDLTGPWAR